MLGGKLFRQILGLYSKQPWLRDKEEELLDLFERCENESEQHLVIDLLSRFCYLKQGEFTGNYKRVLTGAIDDWGLSQESTRFVASTFDGDADSGQFVLYAIKGLTATLGWDSVKTANQVGKAVKSGKLCPKIVLVDEFVGTGKSMVGRIDWLRNNGAGNCEIYVCAVAGMKPGIDNIAKSCNGVKAGVILERGISDYYTGTDLKVASESMDRLEAILSSEYNGTALCNFGYGRSEALYAREEGHVPNNVFPIFWWSYLSDGGRRPTILHRLMGEA